MAEGLVGDGSKRQAQELIRFHTCPAAKVQERFETLGRSATVRNSALWSTRQLRGLSPLSPKSLTRPGERFRSA